MSFFNMAEMKAANTTEAQVEGGAVETTAAAASSEAAQQSQEQQQQAAPEQQAAAPTAAEQAATAQAAEAAQQQAQQQSAAQQGQDRGDQAAQAAAQQSAQADQEQQQQATPTVEEMEATFRAKMLKELNVENWDALEQRVNPPANETPEQAKRREDMKKAAVQSYAVSNLNMAPEEFVRMENVKKMSDQELVYDTWEQEWMKENKDNPDFAGKDLKTEARYEFEEFFHLNSENLRIKTQAEKTIASTATQIRSTLESNFKNAETEYDNAQGFHANLAQFKTAVKSSLNVLPTERSFKISETENVVYSLDKVDKGKLETYLVNDNNFDFFMKKGGQEAAAFLNAKINEYIVLNHHEDMVNAAIITARAVGLKEGKVGAKAPFVETSTQQQTNTVADDLTSEDRAQLRKAMPGVFRS